MADLEVIAGKAKGKVFNLAGKQTFTLGRGYGVDIFLEDRGCSRNHCKVEKRGDGFYVVDLGASYGTKVNGTKIKEQRLEDGDQLRLGKSVLIFKDAAAAAAAPAANPFSGSPLPPAPCERSLALPPAERRARLERGAACADSDPDLDATQRLPDHQPRSGNRRLRARLGRPPGRSLRPRLRLRRRRRRRLRE